MFLDSRTRTGHDALHSWSVQRDVREGVVQHGSLLLHVNATHANLPTYFIFKEGPSFILRS